MGARLQQVTQPGDRVAILCPQNLNYLVAFFGALYAGRIAVPLFDPTEPGHVGRLHAVLDDCTPVDDPDHHRRRRGRPQVLPRPLGQGAAPRHRRRRGAQRGRLHLGAAEADENTIAYLQYTSGSTRTPTGVEITHLNLPTNVLQVLEALDGKEGDRGLCWLPFFHDMGLITALLSPVIGHNFTFMTPAAFVRRPGRWIREMARKPEDTGLRRHLRGAELRVRARGGPRGAQGR